MVEVKRILPDFNEQSCTIPAKIYKILPYLLIVQDKACVFVFVWGR